MASLATFVNRFVGAGELADAPPAVWTRTDTPRLRPLANEDVYLFVKRIDNTAVVRAADPAARTARGRSMVTGFIAAMLVIAGLVPTAYNTTAGFTVQHLQTGAIAAERAESKTGCRRGQAGQYRSASAVGESFEDGGSHAAASRDARGQVQSGSPQPVAACHRRDGPLAKIGSTPNRGRLRFPLSFNPSHAEAIEVFPQIT